MRTPQGPIFLAGHSRERPPVVCGLSGMPVGKLTGHRQSALASITVDGGPLRENWDGPHRAIGAFRTRYRFALVLVDYATRYPEAVPLRSISAKSLAEALFRIISRVGISSRSEIQYVLDLRAKLHTLGRLSMENLLQAQDRQTRLYNRGTRLRGSLITRSSGRTGLMHVRFITSTS